MEEDKQLTKKEKRALAKEQKKLERERSKRTASLTKWIVVLVIAGFIGFGVYKFYTWVTTPAPGAGDLTTTLKVADNEWIKGNPEGQFTLVEYSDFQCPACAQYASIMSGVLEQVDDLRLVYRHFPLTSIHPNAFDAARAAEAAGAQNKFFEYHDLLFQSQSDWSEERNPEGKFGEYAQQLGLDSEKFKQDYDSDEVRSAVTADITSGNGLRINSTPTFYLNGEKISAPTSVDEFVELLSTQTEN